jgi:hypothetical protein
MDVVLQSRIHDAFGVQHAVFQESAKRSRRVVNHHQLLVAVQQFVCSELDVLVGKHT